RIPWRRRLVLTTVSDAPFISPRTLRLLRSMPSHRKVYSFTSLRGSLRTSLRCAVAIAMMSLPMPLFVGDCLDFLEVRHSLLDLQQAGLPQIANPFLLRLLVDVEVGAVVHDDFAYLVACAHEILLEL